MKTTLYGNRTCVTFTFRSKGGGHIKLSNKITTICKRHNAQEMIFSNISPWKYDKNGKIIGEQIGSSGGTCTFHSHSCEHRAAAEELIQLLEENGQTNSYFEEVIRTHRADGTAYKCPQVYVEPFKPLLMF